MYKVWRVAFAFAAVLAACSSQRSAQAPTPGPSLHNPIDFPLYAGSKIISTRSFTQVVNAPSGTSAPSIFAAGNGTYSGVEVIASSGAAFDELASWVTHVSAHPPAGYGALDSTAPADMHARVRGYGIDYAAFQRTVGEKNQGVLVIVMDPQLVSQRFGIVLGLIGKYRSLPPMLRSPIDEQVKSRLGMTVSDATQPDSPIGATLEALDQFGHRNSRGIVLLTAVKR